jgi:hypothetical protein
MSALPTIQEPSMWREKRDVGSGHVKPKPSKNPKPYVLSSDFVAVSDKEQQRPSPL